MARLWKKSFSLRTNLGSAASPVEYTTRNVLRLVPRGMRSTQRTLPGRAAGESRRARFPRTAPLVALVTLAYTANMRHPIDPKEGESYRKLRPTYAIWLLGQTLLPDAPEYAHEFRLRDQHGLSFWTTAASGCWNSVNSPPTRSKPSSSGG